MKTFRLFLLLTALLISTACKQSKPQPIEDGSRILSSEISNQLITSFCEDRFGHVWIGTLRGVNKCVGHQFQQYFYSDDDSLSLSDNQVYRMLRDSKGRLWIGTSAGICYYTNNDTFHRVPIDGPDKTIGEIMEDSKGNVYISIVPSIYIYNEKTDHFSIAIPDANSEKSYASTCFVDPSDNLWSVGMGHISCYQNETYRKIKSMTIGTMIQASYIDPLGRLWLVSDNKLSVLNTKTLQYISLPDELAHHPLFSSSIVYGITYYIKNSSILFSTSKGFFIYDFKNHTLINQNDASFPFSIPPSFTVMKMFVDSQQNLWVGSSDKGFIVKYRHQNRFNNNAKLRSLTENKSVLSVTYLKGYVWINMGKEGVIAYNLTDKSVHPVSLPFLHGKAPYYLYTDRDQHLWISEMFSGNFHQCDVRGYNVSLIKTYQIPFTAFSWTQDKDGTIYVGGWMPNIAFHKIGSDKFNTVPLSNGRFAFCASMLTLNNGNVTIMPMGDDIRITNPKTNKTQTVPFKQFGKHTSIIPNCALEAKDGVIWIGTRGNGLFLLKDGKVSPLKGNSCPDIADIQQDKQGNIWISSLYGLSKYDSKSKKFTNYFKLNGIGGNQFNDRSSCITPDGTIFFGGTHGLTFFNPSDLKLRRNIPLLFESLKVNNQLILPTNSDCIDKAMLFAPDIHLNYDQRSFSISFAAIDYSEYDCVHYFYKIDGYDKYWIESGSDHEAYYSNLPAGKYKFRVKITSSDENDVIAENSINIYVAHAPWASWWAILVYLIIIGISTWYIHQNLKRLRLQKLKTQKAEMEKEAELHTNQMNMRFFSNISHEFRTPLTMISGPIASLSSNRQLPAEAKQLLNIVQRSVNRMLRLVNQLMDFQKLENDVMKLQVTKRDIISAINDTVAIFKVNADEKNITLNKKGLEDSFITWFDSDKLEKMMNNLLSNAMKFTSAEGRIDVLFDATATEVNISVGDSGPGIPEDKQKDIFKRYYQIENEQLQCNWGTGIGLYYTKRLVELHHGTITVTNKEEGGALFTITLPIGDTGYSEEEKKQQEEPSLVLKDRAIPMPQIEEKEEDEDNRSTILVVDDDPEVANYMKTYLSTYFKVECKFDAKSAYKELEEISPDLIVCDVLMPEVDGYQFCRMVKQNISYCHIPVILLTAKTLVEDQVKGLNEGANAYVTKPFDPSYLLALIESQLKNQENLRNVLGHATETKNIDSAFLSDHDSAFMNELYQLMEKELSNSELNITRITEVMHISRTKFYYKMKGLTGSNPNIFFKTYKLNRAAELITEGKYNISEIADMTGFSTLSHFSSSFKKHFGITPSEYK